MKRIDETLDPELIAERLVATYERKGYTREWINQRLQAISARKELTDEWKDRGVQKSSDYAILTDEITRAWSGMTTRQYKNLKGLKKESLRDNMSTLELVLNMLAEVSTKEISEAEKPKGLQQKPGCGPPRRDNRRGCPPRGRSADGPSCPLPSKNAEQLNHVVSRMIETSAAEIESPQDDTGEEKTDD